MLTEKELLETIEECKTAKPTAEKCQLMAACYIVLDHLFPKTNQIDTAQAQTNVQAKTASNSEFVQAAIVAGMERTLEVLDEHMECIKALYPKEYRAVLRMLSE